MRDELVKFLIQETQSVRFLKTAVLLLTFLRHWAIFKVALNLTKLIAIVAGSVMAKTIGNGVLLLFTWVKWGQFLADIWTARLNVWPDQIVRQAKRAIETERATGLSSHSSTILSSIQLHKYKQYKEGENSVLRCHKITSEKKLFNRHRPCGWEADHISHMVCIGDAVAQLKNLSLIFASELCLMRMFAGVCKASNSVI